MQLILECIMLHLFRNLRLCDARCARITIVLKKKQLWGSRSSPPRPSNPKVHVHYIYLIIRVRIPIMLPVIKLRILLSYPGKFFCRHVLIHNFQLRKLHHKHNLGLGVLHQLIQHRKSFLHLLSWIIWLHNQNLCLNIILRILIRILPIFHFRNASTDKLHRARHHGYLL